MGGGIAFNWGLLGDNSLWRYHLQIGLMSILFILCFLLLGSEFGFFKGDQAFGLFYTCSLN